MPAIIQLDLSALHHNFQRIRTLAPGRSILAMIKANAYGHDAIQVARALPDAEAFGVACIVEGVQLRNAGITQDIVLMQGFFTANDLAIIIQHQLQIVVHDWYQLEILEQQQITSPLVIWLKIDTGMHRLGFLPEAVPEVITRLQRLDCVKESPRLMTHFSAPEEINNSVTLNQFKLFQKTIQQYPGARSLANSAAILAWPDTLGDWVRPGIMLYGVSPFPQKCGNDHDLKPVMNWCSTLTAIHHLRKGDSVGYNSTWICPEDMLVGVVSAGYGDGYPRQAKNGTPVLVNNKSVPLIGRVSMDMITVDLRSQADAKIGDPVVLWGADLPVEVIARSVEMSPYQLLCGVRVRG